MHIEHVSGWTDARIERGWSAWLTGLEGHLLYRNHSTCHAEAECHKDDYEEPPPWPATTVAHSETPAPGRPGR